MIQQFWHSLIIERRSSRQIKQIAPLALFTFTITLIIIGIPDAVYTKEFGINPPFGLEWRNTTDEILHNSTELLRPATREDVKLIGSKLSYLYEQIVLFVADECVLYNLKFKGYILTTNRTRKLSDVCLLRENSSYKEFTDIVNIISDKYGASRIDSGTGLCFWGIKRYKTIRWIVKQSTVQVSIVSCGERSELIIVYSGMF